MNDLNDAISTFLDWYLHNGDREQAEQKLQKLVSDAYAYGQKTALSRVRDFVTNL